MDSIFTLIQLNHLKIYVTKAVICQHISVLKLGLELCSNLKKLECCTQLWLTIPLEFVFKLEKNRPRTCFYWKILTSMERQKLWIVLKIILAGAQIRWHSCFSEATRKARSRILLLSQNYHTSRLNHMVHGPRQLISLLLFLKISNQMLQHVERVNQFLELINTHLTIFLSKTSQILNL